VQGADVIRGLIFDFDGLILDTEGPEYQAWNELFLYHGAELDFATWSHCIGTSASVFDPHAHLEGLLGRELDRAALRAEHRTRCDQLIAAQCTLPGIESYLASARQLGLKVGLASSSSRAWVSTHLARLGLLEQFQCLRTRDDVERVKPDPALYLAVLAALDLQPAEAIALEDSPNGVLAARRAGLYCVAVPNPLTGRLDLGQADLIVPCLADLPLPELLECAGKGKTVRSAVVAAAGEENR
jgi:HAD superfamily hydrolase (TIGR01509 family)